MAEEEEGEEEEAEVVVTMGEALRFSGADFLARLAEADFSFIDRRKPLGKAGKQIVICNLSLEAVTLCVFSCFSRAEMKAKLRPHFLRQIDKC